MKSLFNGFGIVMLALFLHLSTAQAFPPAPTVLIYGMVRNQYGAPVTDPTAVVILQAPGGAQVTAKIQPNLAIGINYALRVPMDSGSIPILYTSNALTNGQSYTLYVYAGGVTNTPLEMVGGPMRIVAPSQTLIQNLTLGTDVNGDGIPDAWETGFLQSLGLNTPLAGIDRNAFYTHDGRTLYQEYLLGNYPYSSNAFSVTIVSQTAGSALLAFTTTASRTYTAFGSADLKTWSPLSFIIPAISAQPVSSYSSPIIQPLQIQTVQPPSAPQFQFFKLVLQ